MFVHSAQTQGAMLALKRRKNPVFFGFSSKKGPNDNCKVGFDIPQQALNLPPHV